MPPNGIGQRFEQRRQAAGDLVELLGDVLSDALQCAAALAEGIARDKHLLVARQTVGQRLAL
ncbi:MAG: hypothetical protein AAF183_20580, partial [Pseudomonadota bacterium]